ncbi:MAG: hypothetical protein ACFFA5_08945 [Promethearchaeota archaeon]
MLTFLKEKGIAIKDEKTNDTEFWIETSDGFITIKFIVDMTAQKIVYDVFSPKYDKHLKFESIKNIEKLEFIEEEHRTLEHKKSIEVAWFTLEWVRFWAYKNNFNVNETHLI